MHHHIIERPAAGCGSCSVILLHLLTEILVLPLPCYGTPDQILPVRLRGRFLLTAYFKVTECHAPPARLFSLRARHLCRGGRLVFKHMIKYNA